MGIFIYIGSNGDNKPPKDKAVNCEVIDNPNRRTVADLMLEPTPEEIAAAEKRQAIAAEEGARKAEKARLELLKLEDPERYKEETAGRRRFTIFICSFIAIFFILLATMLMLYALKK